METMVKQWFLIPLMCNPLTTAITMHPPKEMESVELMVGQKTVEVWMAF